MPGGRNKSIGPVTLNEGEIERVLNGVEFEQERRKLNFTISFNTVFYVSICKNASSCAV